MLYACDQRFLALRWENMDWVEVVRLASEIWQAINSNKSFSLQGITRRFTGRERHYQWLKNYRHAKRRNRIGEWLFWSRSRRV